MSTYYTSTSSAESSAWKKRLSCFNKALASKTLRDAQHHLQQATVWNEELEGEYQIPYNYLNDTRLTRIFAGYHNRITFNIMTDEIQSKAKLNADIVSSTTLAQLSALSERYLLGMVNIRQGQWDTMVEQRNTQTQAANQILSLAASIYEDARR